MIDLLLAAALLQAPAAQDPCAAVPGPQPRPANCPAWEFVGRTEQGSLFVDPGSIRRNGDVLEMTSRVVLSADHADRTRSVLLRERVDCRARTVAELSVAVYDARGVLLFAAPSTGANAAPAAFDPRTEGGAQMEALCRR